MPDTSAHDVLNSLTAHIAVLDESGVIVAVNEAWKRFAIDNLLQDAGFCVGKNYLAICEQSCASDAGGTANSALAGLRSILRGETDVFTIEYPCHSPDEERWFCLRATRCAGARTAVVVSHEDITLRRKSEDALRETERTLRQVLQQLERALVRERVLARTDELTGTTNRRYFFELAEQEIAAAKRLQQPLSVILFDVDHFKRINDTAGHDAGDAALRRIASLTAGHLRQPDLFARYGGEEFILLLPRTTIEEAVAVAEQIRMRISGEIAVTISSGVAALAPGEDSIDLLIRRADDALYQAKQEGRNRTLSRSAQQ